MTQTAPVAADTVVVWEDDPVRRPLLAAILRGAGIRVELPLDSASALDAASAGDTAVLVLDANVACPSGSEFLRELRHRRRGHAPPTVALLQPGQACLRHSLRALGAERLISEPFDPAQLVTAVEQLRPPRAEPS